MTATAKAKTKAPAHTIRAALRDAAARLKAADIATPLLDAKLLLRASEGLGAAALIAEEERLLKHSARFLTWIERRAAGEPVSRILGSRGFWKHDFLISPSVLDPRSDTETLVEAVLAAFPDRSEQLLILDLGVGSGCILLSLLAEYVSAHGLGVDVSADALDIAAQNAAALDVSDRYEGREGDWWAGLEHDRFDVIVSNPPYIPQAEIAGLAREVRDHDPALALDGGVDGLDAYRAILAHASEHVAPRGRLFLELGHGQAAAVAALAPAARLQVVTQHRDLSGTVRCLGLAHAY